MELVDEFYSRNFLVYEFFVFVFAPPPPLKLNGLSLKKKGQFPAILTEQACRLFM